MEYEEHAREVLEGHLRMGVGLALYQHTKQAGPTDRLTPLKTFANPGFTPKTNEVHALDKILRDDDQQQRRMPN